MRVLIIGAGATIQEGIVSGKSSEFKFATMQNFAKEMWRNFCPEPFLSYFLYGLNTIPSTDPKKNVELFCELEQRHVTNVERFFEFCWQHKDRILDHPTAWHDMIYGCCFMPILDAMIHCFFENGKGWVTLRAGADVISRMQPGDLVVNLNYDVAFDIAIEQSGRSFEYVPIAGNATSIQIAKPHGSINLLVDRGQHSFCFCAPTQIPGSHESNTESLSESILPPRLNKDYQEHPISKAIIDPLYAIKPDILSYWGVGLTESDVDLTNLYNLLAANAKRIEFINPCELAAKKAEESLRRKVNWYPQLELWLSQPAA